MRIAVTGSKGQVVSALAERGPISGATVLPAGRPDLDLLDQATVFPALERLKPDVIVSAAAYTAVDKAETDRDSCWRINAGGAGLIAAAARNLGVPVIHLSTDYVFDGTKETAWVESDPVGPLNVYGASKLAGEFAVSAANPDHVILRVAWIVSPFGNNFVKTMLRLGSTRDAINVVADQYGGPTSALDIADGILSVAANLLRSPEDTALRGTFHMVPEGTASWAELASAVFLEAEPFLGKRVQVNPIAALDYPVPAARPANSTMDGTKLFNVHGVQLPDWHSSISHIVKTINTEAQF
ncbi:dTDP-4-dehydrorhamnose reductase [Pannonibacter sp. P2PFMT1]|uniref:dTDP-4-dehydrorhamnose reductase n=1 Tax=Pannonibacter sp. P2PFMT1 TaxID=2003582 RepID=UPI0016456ACB|nr:dTDP-4-dehydrorhamnose reductase [Pannonibacter sp. P2PFMT1]